MDWLRHNFVHTVICLALYVPCLSFVFRWQKRTLEVLFIGQSKFNDFFLLLLFVAVEFLFQDFSSQCMVHCTT